MVEMKQKKILCIGPLAEQVTAEFGNKFDLVAVDESSRSEALAHTDEDVILIIARGSVVVDREFMEKAPELAVVARSGVGYDTVSIEDATLRKIPVVYTPGAMSRAVAEHTVSFLLTSLKGLDGWKQSLRRGDWHIRYKRFGSDLRNKVIGIVGYGRIGKQVRSLLRPFDVRVLANDPYINHAQFADHQVEFVSFDELLNSSDIVSLHVPLTEETRGMINGQNISSFQPEAVLINTARGAVVESLDLLYEALETGQLAAVGIDVFPKEPPDTAHPLFGHPRAFLTPHVAARTPAAQNAIQMTMIGEIRRIFAGEAPNLENIVNPEVLGAGGC
jgi:D-3-phosphoglycerate dehydrogenase